jgi:hypothetical protein
MLSGLSRRRLVLLQLLHLRRRRRLRNGQGNVEIVVRLNLIELILKVFRAKLLLFARFLLMSFGEVVIHEIDESLKVRLELLDVVVAGALDLE